jgi:hypothetical protein
LPIFFDEANIIYIFANLLMKTAPIKTALIIFALILFNQIVSAQVNDTIVYSSSKKIEWGYFKGKPKKDTLAAAISTTICLETEKVSFWDGRVTFKCYAVMYPYESWVRSNYMDLKTLQHEQIHFDITEACARALETEINNMRIRSVKSPQIRTTFDKWVNKLEDLQKQYDKETRGGNDPVAQNFWNAQTLSELTSKFSDSND